MKEEQIQKYVNGLMIEQDEDSPHRYLKKGFFNKNQMVLADIGAAEGNISLSVIRKCSKVYLFECDSEWREPLRLTFKPYAEKVVIVPKFVSDFDKDEHVSLDTYFADKDIDCIKADIEGAEIACLLGGESVIRHKVSQVAICAYHAPDALATIEAILKQYGYETSVSKGYMVWDLDKDKRRKGTERFLRRGLVYGNKKASAFE